MLDLLPTRYEFKTGSTDGSIDLDVEGISKGQNTFWTLLDVNSSINDHEI